MRIFAGTVMTGSSYLVAVTTTSSSVIISSVAKARSGKNIEEINRQRLIIFFMFSSLEKCEIVMLRTLAKIGLPA
jgi:hypothetical protein